MYYLYIQFSSVQFSSVIICATLIVSAAWNTPLGVFGLTDEVFGGPSIKVQATLLSTHIIYIAPTPYTRTLFLPLI